MALPKTRSGDIGGGCRAPSVIRRLLSSLSALALIPLRALLMHGSEQRDLSVLFDTSYYLANNPDVARTRWPPLWHYLLFGAVEKRNPNPFFDTAFYHASHPDVARRGLNPLLHYILHGAAEGRRPNPFAGDLSSGPAADGVSRDPLVQHILQQGCERAHSPGSPQSIKEPAEADLPSGRRTSVSISAVVLTKNGAQRLPACLRSIVEAKFADELIVCIDDTTTDDSYSAAVPFTKQIHYVKTNGNVESALSKMVSLCSGDYILRVDDDECIRGAWDTETIESLVRLNDISHFLLPRCWLIPPGDVFIADDPWFPDLHPRLFVNDPRRIRYPTQIHDHMLIEGRGIVLWGCWIDHLNLVTKSRIERERKCEEYRRLRPDHDLSYFYFYEEQDMTKIQIANKHGVRSALRQSSLWKALGS
jgi:hypothetical protein